MAEPRDPAQPQSTVLDPHATYIALLRTLCKAEGGNVCDSPVAGTASTTGNTPPVPATVPPSPIGAELQRPQPVAAAPDSTARPAQQQAPSGPATTPVVAGAGPTAAPTGVVGTNVVPRATTPAGEPDANVRAAKDELTAVSADELKDARTYVYKKMNTQWKFYERASAKVLDSYKARAQSEKELSEAMVQLALVPLFFFGSGMIGEVVKRAGPLIRPILEGAKVAVDRIDKIAGAKFRPDLASEVIKEAFKLARVAVSKEVTSASTCMETMVAYTQTFSDSLPGAFAALAGSIDSAKNVDGLAAILAAVETMTPEKFAKDYEADAAKFEKQVVPTLQKAHVVAVTELGGSVMSSRNAKIKIGSRTFRAQVMESTLPISGTDYNFVSWIEFPINESPNKGLPLELSPAQVKLPSEPPPPASATDFDQDAIQQ